MEKLERFWEYLPCLAALAVFVWCMSTTATSSARVSGDDTRITQEVQTKIFQEPMLRTAFLNVYTSDGVVKFTGNAERPVDLEIAKELAERTPGVVKVDIDLVTVRDHTAHGR